MIVVKLQIKDVVKNSGYGIDNVSNNFTEKLNEKVKDIIEESCRRAKENGRKTVMAKDL